MECSLQFLQELPLPLPIVLPLFSSLKLPNYSHKLVSSSSSSRYLSLQRGRERLT